MARPLSAGYSGKSLAAKLGVKHQTTLLVLDPPPHYADLIEPLPPGARVVAVATDPDIVHAFFPCTADLAAAAPSLVWVPRAGGSIWISWPKKTSALFRDLTEDGVRAVMLPTGWVDVKVCAVDADWSGLKFLRRRA